MTSQPEFNPAANRKISILGCGWYGLPLAQALTKAGYTVSGSTTTPEKMDILAKAGITPYLVDLQETSITADKDFFKSPILVICIPPKRATAEQHTFVSKIKNIATSVSINVKQVIFISSTSVYGDHSAEVFEDTPPNPDSDSGKAMLEAEEYLTQCKEFTTTVIRFGGLIGPGRNPGRFFAGKSDIPNGRAPVNLIHLNDCIALTLRIIETGAFKMIYNACSPQHPSRADFYTAVAKSSGMEIPAFVDELSKWKIVSSRNVPEKLAYQYSIGMNNLVSQ